jgi:two-component system NtrC family sensor kinase
MIAAVTLIAALAYWDEKRESATALQDLAQEQATLAASVANAFATRLADVRQDLSLASEQYLSGRGFPKRLAGNYLELSLVSETNPAPSSQVPGFVVEAPAGPGKRIRAIVAPSELLLGLAHLERANALALFIAPPAGAPLRTVDGRKIVAPELARALAASTFTARLTGPQAAALGLPDRTALAGLARVDAGPLGTWGISVVASAERERDRERRAQVRLVLAVGLAAGLVVGFGGFALHNQRKELELERELAVAELARERDERLARLSKAATMVTLASGVAHEVSTPLGVISGRAEQILERVSDERTRRSAQAILDQSERIKEVIRGLLELARGGSLALVEHRFQKGSVRLRSRVSGTLPPLRCDPRLLEQALVNLLLNACDACPPGSTVEVSVTPDAAGVSFVVSDDGEGIPAAHAARAAEPFFTTKPRGKGTGLGLAIVSEIAKSHRGSLSISPGEPRGTRACIHIPLAQGEGHA